MPARMLKPCSYPGCSALTRDGRCELHPKSPVTYQRDPHVQRLYDRKWQRRRQQQLSQHPWCEDCLQDKIYTPAVDVHHEVRHRGDRLKFNTSPLRSLCKSHHTLRTNAERRGTP